MSCYRPMIISGSMRQPSCTRNDKRFSDKITFNAIPYIFDGAAHMPTVLVELRQHGRSLKRGDLNVCLTDPKAVSLHLPVFRPHALIQLFHHADERYIFVPEWRIVSLLLNQQ